MNRYINTMGFQVDTYSNPETGKWPHRVRVTHIPTGAEASEIYTGQYNTAEMRDRLIAKLNESIKMPKVPGRKAPPEADDPGGCL